MDDRVSAVWARIERWLGANAPEALENLGGPAAPGDLETLEETIGFQLPDEVKAIYSVHNGEVGDGPCILGTWDAFLSCRRWRPTGVSMPIWRANSAARKTHRTTGGAQIENGIISVKGPVKPLVGSPRWVPILVEFLEQHADALERGDFAVIDNDLTRVREMQDDPADWGLPEYLREVGMERFIPGGAGPDPDVGRLAEGEEVVIVGRMGELLGGPEIVFTLVTEQGTEYSILATSRPPGGTARSRSGNPLA
ncbi:MAG TPA: hypothetical protein VE685_06920 [Thermoanaerobaculia bacterium]|nr:hypothetical protein [Thermoanaerobaculia bacterium]